MSFKATTVSALLAVTAFAAAAPAQADGFYISTFAGLSFQEDQRNVRTEVILAGPPTIDVTFDTGYFIGGSLGYAFDNVGIGGIRVELEYAYRENDVEAVFFPGPVRQLESRDNSSGSVMLNAFYEFDTGVEWVRPYVGGGLGIAGVESDTVYAPPSGNRDNPTVEIGGSTETEFAYQFIAGFTVPVSEHWEAFIEGRYYETGDPDFERIRLSDDALLARYDSEYSTWHGDIGIRYRF